MKYSKNIAILGVFSEKERWGSQILVSSWSSEQQIVVLVFLLRSRAFTTKTRQVRTEAAIGNIVINKQQGWSISKCVLNNFKKFTEKHLCLGLFCNEVAVLSFLIKKRLWRRSFPINFAKFLRTSFLQNTSWRLLLCSERSCAVDVSKGFL